MIRLLFQIKLADPTDERVDQLLRGAYRALGEDDGASEVDTLLGSIFQRMPESTFTHVIVPLFQDGIQTFAGKPQP